MKRKPGLTRFAIMAFLAGAIGWGWTVLSPGGRPEGTPASQPGGHADYVHPSTCAEAGCHPDRVDSYFAAGLSAGRIDQVPILEDWEVRNTYHHALSDRFYRVFIRDGRYFHERYQLDEQGRQRNVIEREVHYVIGSGRHARTYVHRTDQGKLLQLPLGWYSADGGYWAMSPGYDRPDHAGMRREITQECIFCHSGYPSVYGDEPMGPIECQRCHGPGRRHVEDARAGRIVRGNILSFADLTPERQTEVCMQCHLETTSHPLPGAIRRFDRPAFSYKAGEPLSDFVLFFDHRPGTDFDEKFEANNATYRLFKSRCYVESKGLMSCLTCHHANHLLMSADVTENYEKACRSCHPADSLACANLPTNPPGSNCISCHMPKRRTENAAHQVRTDHAILRRPPPGDLLAPVSELEMSQKRAYQGEVRLYYPTRLPSERDRLYLAVAQVRDGSNLSSGIRMLEDAIREFKPGEVEFQLELAHAYRRSGDTRNARRQYELVMRLAPDSASAYFPAAEILLREGRPDTAISLLERAASRVGDDSRILTMLGIALGQQGRVTESVDFLERAVRANPDDPRAWLNLGFSYEQAGKYPTAAGAYYSALRAQPDFAFAHLFIGNLMKGLRQPQSAEYHYRKAVELDPNLRDRVDQAAGSRD